MTPVFLYEGYEACTYRMGSKVVKVYKPSYYQYNLQFNRIGEAEFLRRHQSEFFISVIESNPFYMVMPYAGESIGNCRELVFGLFDVDALLLWLDRLRAELLKLRVLHRDINPSNILYDEQTRNFKLIDFGWAIGHCDKELVVQKPFDMNPYGPSDMQAISNLLKSIKSR